MLRTLGRVHDSTYVVDGDWLRIPYSETRVDGKRLRYVQSNRVGAKRLKTLFLKEPTTIPWLESFRAEDTFIDIGANIGLYSIYAAAMTGARVFSFEPEALNFAELNKNIFVNELHGSVLAYCIALSNEDRVDRLLLGGFTQGLSHHDFGESSWTEDKSFGAVTTSREARLAQGCVGFRLDTLVENGFVPPPQHIKIDVDGLEHKVVEGAWATFQRPELKSILIEIDHRIPHCRDIIERMQSIGWRFSIHQVRSNRKRIFSPEDIDRMRREGLGGFNYIFYKDPFYDRMFEDFVASYVPPMAPKAASEGQSLQLPAAAQALLRQLRPRTRLNRLLSVFLPIK
jgi:FkbM family methyltransferase